MTARQDSSLEVVEQKISLDAVSTPDIGEVEIDRGTANSHCFDDQIIVEGICIAFASEPWSDRIANALERPDDADRVRTLKVALRLFVGAAVPVASEINPRGHKWCEAYLDHALAEAHLVLLEKRDGA